MIQRIRILRTNTTTNNLLYNLTKRRHFFNSSSSSQSNLPPHNRPPITPHPTHPPKLITPTTHPHIPLPIYAQTSFVPPSSNHHPILHTSPASLSRLRAAARLARRILDLTCTLAEPDVATDAIDDIIHEAILKEGAYPSPLNYAGFPKSLCSSVNEVICHGIPDGRPLRKGDIVSFDVSCFLDGYHGDNCATVIVGGEGESDEVGVALVNCARECLDEAIKACRPGGCLSDIGNTIQTVVDGYGFDTVKRYRGHGIGRELHMPPFVKHFANDDKMELLPGMVFTIEPMITEGRADCEEWDDDWTVVTLDGGRAAQFEHMVLITETGVEVLTVNEEKEEKEKELTTSLN